MRSMKGAQTAGVDLLGPGRQLLVLFRRLAGLSAASSGSSPGEGRRGGAGSSAPVKAAKEARLWMKWALLPPETAGVPARLRGLLSFMETKRRFSDLQGRRGPPPVPGPGWAWRATASSRVREDSRSPWLWSRRGRQTMQARSKTMKVPSSSARSVRVLAAGCRRAPA